MDQKKSRLQIVGILFVAVGLLVFALVADAKGHEGLNIALTFGGAIFTLVAAVSLLANND